MLNLNEKYFTEEKMEYYSLRENEEIVVGVTDRNIAEKWLEQKLEKGIENVSIKPVEENFEKIL